MKAGHPGVARRRRSLLAQASLGNVLVMVGAAVGITSLVLWTERTGLRTQLALRAATSAEFVASQSAFPMLIGDRQELTRIAKAAVANEDVLYVIVANQEGRTMASVVRNEADDTEKSDISGDLPASVEAQQPIEEPSGKGLFDWEVNRAANRRLGTVRVGLSMNKQQGIFARLAREVLLVAMLAISLILGMQYIQLRRLLRPLAILMGFAKQVSRGDLSQRAPLGACNEVADLAQAFNDMVAQLDASRRELLEQVDQTRHASLLKSQFLANMSHEIRTPMNGIIGMTDLTLATPLDSAQREYLTTVKESAQSLMAIINDILDFSKIEAGKLRLDPAPFDVSELIDQSVRGMALRAHQKNLELVVEIAPSVQRRLVGDAGRLRQVLVNLIGNAIKFTGRGQILLQVSGDAAEHGQQDLHFVVEDTGIGIAADKLRSIFEAFDQADGSTSRTYGGTGLGLAIVSKLTQMMHGRIWVESDIGLGSRFHFTVRMRCADTLEVSEEQSEKGRLKAVRVLAVDDNPSNRKVVAGILSELGMQAVMAESAAQALEMFQKARVDGHPFQLAILDADMPGVNGFELARKILDDPGLAGAIVMMLKSSNLDADITSCSELWLDCHVIKPVSRASLRESMLCALGHPTVHPAVAPGEASESLRRLSILLAEDNLVNQKLAVRLLEKRGHTITTVANGREAVEAFERDHFDLVLMDVQMPEMDGWTATEVIRDRERGTGAHVPILALTAHALKEHQDRCYAAGMDGFVTKPFEAARLYEAVENAAG